MLRKSSRKYSKNTKDWKIGKKKKESEEKSSRYKNKRNSSKRENGKEGGKGWRKSS